MESPCSNQIIRNRGQTKAPPDYHYHGPVYGLLGGWPLFRVPSWMISCAGTQYDLPGQDSENQYQGSGIGLVRTEK